MASQRARSLHTIQAMTNGTAKPWDEGVFIGPPLIEHPLQSGGG